MTVKEKTSIARLSKSRKAGAKSHFGRSLRTTTHETERDIKRDESNGDYKQAKKQILVN